MTTTRCYCCKYRSTERVLVNKFECSVGNFEESIWEKKILFGVGNGAECRPEISPSDGPEIVAARLGMEPRSSCSTSQELNHYTTALGMCRRYRLKGTGRSFASCQIQMDSVVRPISMHISCLNSRQQRLRKEEIIPNRSDNELLRVSLRGNPSGNVPQPTQDTES